MVNITTYILLLLPAEIKTIGSTEIAVFPKLCFTKPNDISVTFVSRQSGKLIFSAKSTRMYSTFEYIAFFTFDAVKHIKPTSMLMTDGEEWKAFECVFFCKTEAFKKYPKIRMAK
ncbi:hypothetical protein ACTXT7_009002 [Hymenolepis weldensis]